LDEITPGDIEKFKNKRKKEVCNASVNRGLSVLKSMYTKVVNSEDYGIVRNPVKKISLLDEKSERKRILSNDERKRLFHSVKLNPSKNLYLFLIIVLNTGTRKMETLSLKWENVDFSKRILRVFGKGGKWREIPMNDIVIAELTKWKKDSEYVFVNPKTGTFIRNIGKTFMRVCRDAKINNLTIHDLRHTAASHLVNDCSIDIVTASKILGHSNILMTVKYIHPTDEHKRIAVDRLGEIFKKGRKKVDKRHVTIPAERSPLPHMKYH
jgi:integrase